MIYYFSGTGNSRWVAMEMANETGDKAMDIMDVQSTPSLEGETLGIVFPVYAWGVPEVVLHFVKRLEGKPAFSYAMATCGAEAGFALKKLHKVYPLDSEYSVVMPNNYVLGSELETPEQIHTKIKAAQKQIEEHAQEVLSRKKIMKVHQGKFPLLKSTVVHFGFVTFATRTKPFHVTDFCISCGQCVRDCPAKAMEMDNHKPIYVKPRCFMCAACINKCPVNAIEYGEKTRNRGRYQLETYLP